MAEHLGCKRLAAGELGVEVRRYDPAAESRLASRGHPAAVTCVFPAGDFFRLGGFSPEIAPSNHSWPEEQAFYTLSPSKRL